MTTDITKTNKILSAIVLEEHGYDSALKGLSFNKDSIRDMSSTARRLAPRDLGHNKFMESIQLWIEVRAPRYWWQEADTYRAGSTKQSQSTMHTIKNRILQPSDFVDEEINTEYLAVINDLILRKVSTREIKKMLPEGFMQKRLWNINYKTLRNIILQREHHGLVEWQIFIERVREQVQFPDMLPGNDDTLNEKIEEHFRRVNE
jgi:hypothetical protein